tara:strand:- start:637 stop:825 length:189 start_codon:yes stop_codon:yes gene_type:complete
MKFPTPKLKNYRPYSNIQTSITIKKEDELEYQKLRSLLYERHQSLGDYLISSYKELDKQYFK